MYSFQAEIRISADLRKTCAKSAEKQLEQSARETSHQAAARPCGSLLFRLLEPQFPTIVSLVLMLVLLPLLLDALDSYLENRQSKLGAMKELVRADSTPKATT